MDMELLKSVSFSVPSRTLIDEALRKFRLIEENTEKIKSDLDMKKLKQKLINLCFGATQDMDYLQVETHLLAMSLLE